MKAKMLKVLVFDAVCLSSDLVDTMQYHVLVHTRSALNAKMFRPEKHPQPRYIFTFLYLINYLKKIFRTY